MQDPLTGVQIGTLHPSGSVSEPEGPPLTTWEDSGDEMLLASEEIEHGDGAFRYFIRVDYLEDSLTEEELKEVGGNCDISIYAVSPAMAGEDVVDQAIKSCYGDPKEVPPEYRDRAAYEALLRYGVYAPLWSFVFDDEQRPLEEGLQQAKKQLAAIALLFGFYMDRPVNAIGNSGWDFIRGDIG